MNLLAAVAAGDQNPIDILNNLFKFDQALRIRKVDLNTIREAVDSVDKKRYLLPAIQREFVWSTGQIECLFDSLMRDYPIGIFLVWHVEKENIRNYCLFFSME